MRDDSLEHQVARAEKEILALKTSQPSGNSNITGFISNTVFIEQFLNTPPQTGRLTATFTADRQVGAMTAIEMDVYMNGHRYEYQDDGFIYYVFDYQTSSDPEVAKYQRSVVLIVQTMPMPVHLEVWIRATSTDTGVLTASWSLS